MSFNTTDILFLIAISLFLVGMLILCAGVLTLLRRTLGRDIRTIATQTTQLAQKGMLDGVAGLVGNATALLDATNQLVRTTAGVGVFMIFIGLVMIGFSVFIFAKFL